MLYLISLLLHYTDENKICKRRREKRLYREKKHLLKKLNYFKNREGAYGRFLTYKLYRKNLNSISDTISAGKALNQRSILPVVRLSNMPVERCEETSVKEIRRRCDEIGIDSLTRSWNKKAITVTSVPQGVHSCETISGDGNVV